MTVGGIQVIQGCGRGREGLGKCGRIGEGGQGRRKESFKGGSFLRFFLH